MAEDANPRILRKFESGKIFVNFQIGSQYIQLSIKCDSTSDKVTSGIGLHYINVGSHKIN